jgi:carbonic anhydrase
MKHKKWLMLFSIFTIASLLAISCNNNSEKKEEQTEDKEVVNEQEKHEVHWSYEGETGPEHWAHIVKDCDCGGKSQSPIDINGDMVDKDFVELQLDYQSDSTLDIVNNGHTIKLDYPFGTFMIGEETYKLAQFHFHAGSEHTIGGTRYPLEVHLVHLNEAKNIAVIGILFEEGEENVLLKKIYEKMPDEVNESISEALEIDVNNLLPKERSYYHYSGSLTTPPCTEGVKWFVMKNTITASKEQIERISKFMPVNNYRPVQPLNGRTIEVYD